LDRRAKRKVFVLELGEERAQRDWIHHGAGERMLAECTGLFQNADLDIAEITARFIVGFDHSGKRDRSGQSRRTTTDEEDIHRNCFGVGRLGEDQLLQRERRLVRARKNLRLVFCH
jgi:hypothetical protein